jgi:hypothetical protein
MGQWTKFAISIIPYSTIFPIVMIIIWFVVTFQSIIWPSKYQESVTQGQSITSHKTSILKLHNDGYEFGVHIKVLLLLTDHAGWSDCVYHLYSAKPSVCHKADSRAGLSGRPAELLPGVLTYMGC